MLVGILILTLDLKIVLINKNMGLNQE